MPMTQPQVSVIIAARNAAGTISWAIQSALREPEVVEVLVVDDASTDGTASAAQAADDRSGRLSIHRLPKNSGPAAARNLAIRQSSAPFIGILDADDSYLKGRFANLLGDLEWDLAADNVMFVEERAARRMLDVSPPFFASRPRYLALEEFVDGNISKRGRHRGELGFLKPVIRRSFLERHGLEYDSQLRLGEDFELYARAMISGARFKVSRTCGYAATVRPDSLSGKHRTEDLERLADADRALLALPGLQPAGRAALKRHETHMRNRYRLRRFLDRKADEGLASALAYAVSNGPWPIAVGVATDKTNALARHFVSGSAKREAVRFLMPAEPVRR
jgi:succinoglycan biosynthesis protein ExoU